MMDKSSENPRAKAARSDEQFDDLDNSDNSDNSDDAKVASPLGCSAAFLTLASAQFDELVVFYRQLLSQEPQPYMAGIYAEFHLPQLQLGIFQPKADHTSEFAATSSGGMSLCLEVEDLESAIAHLTQMGYPPPQPMTTASHGREVYAYDPDGNRLILHQGH